MKLWSLTNEYVEVIVNGELIKTDLEYIGSRQVITINRKCYFVTDLKEGQ